MSQRKLDTITNGGVVNDLPHFEISLPEDLQSSVGETTESKAPLFKLPEPVSRKRAADTVIERDELQRELNRLTREAIADLNKKLLDSERRISNLEADLGAARNTIRQLEEGLNYVRGCTKVTYCFVKKAEQAGVVPGWTPMRQQFNFSQH